MMIIVFINCFAIIVALFLIRRRGASKGIAKEPITPSVPTRQLGDDRRLDYQASCQHLQRYDLLINQSIPPLPNHRPRFDDEEPLGINFFRTLIANVKPESKNSLLPVLRRY